MVLVGRLPQMANTVSAHSMISTVGLDSPMRMDVACVAHCRGEPLLSRE